MIKNITITQLEDWVKIKDYIKDGYNAVIYKFSPRCPISKGTNRTFDIWLKRIPNDLKIISAKMDVYENEEIVDVIAEELILTHQSPQVIWIDEDFDVWWHASHYDISAESLNKYLNKFISKSE